jgi:hypothetical protein
MAVRLSIIQQATNGPPLLYLCLVFHKQWGPGTWTRLKLLG